MSWVKAAREGYGELVNAIIRPPRMQYELSELGPEQLRLGQLRATRTDIELQSKRGAAAAGLRERKGVEPPEFKLRCSHWEPHASCRPAERIPCVVYLHGNCGSRVEALDVLHLVLSLGMSLFSLDFGGAGRSDGEYLSLGHWEKEDLAAVVEHLRETETVSTIALWGRSMGAVTALLHAGRDPSIGALIIDSPFASLRQLAHELVGHFTEGHVKVPKVAVSAAIGVIKSSVKKKAHFNLDELCPVDRADQCFIPALFAAAEGDDFIAPHHAQAIHDAYGGDKNLIKFEGDHNSDRPRFYFDSAAIFLQTCLRPGEEAPHMPSTVRGNLSS